MHGAHNKPGLNLLQRGNAHDWKQNKTTQQRKRRFEVDDVHGIDLASPDDPN